MSKAILKLLSIFAILRVFSARKKSTLDYEATVLVVASHALNKCFRFLSVADAKDIISEINPNRLRKDNLVFGTFYRKFEAINSSLKNNGRVNSGVLDEMIKSLFRSLIHYIGNNMLTPFQRDLVRVYPLSSQEVQILLDNVNPDLPTF